LYTMSGWGTSFGTVNEDDVYSGFQSSSYDTGSKNSFMQSKQNNFGNGRLQTSTRMGTALGSGEPSRPMTSVTGAGYQSESKRQTFDPLNEGDSRGPAPRLANKSENSPEHKATAMEREVQRLLEESVGYACDEKYELALEKAKEAGRKERVLCKHREANNMLDSINLDLTFAVCYNLADAYKKNEMLNDALNTYELVVQNKQYPQSGRLRINMGNIYYGKGDYQKAIQQYSKALDQIPNSNKVVRMKIMRNIGCTYFKMGNYSDAIQTFEQVLDENIIEGDIQTPYNLILCYDVTREMEKIKRVFTQMCQTQSPLKMLDKSYDDDLLGGSEEKVGEKDVLRRYAEKREKQFNNRLRNIAKAVAPRLVTQRGSRQADWVAGFDFVISALSDNGHQAVASLMEIEKAMEYMRRRNFSKAIELLKAFEKKDETLKAKAATNLSFLYFLERDVVQADEYADLAVRHDRYNAKALVNKGNCLFANEEYIKAKELYLEAIGVEADCVEAIFNLGLANKKLVMQNMNDTRVVEEGIQAFEKLHSLVPNSPEVIYQIANLYEIRAEQEMKTAQELGEEDPGQNKAVLSNLKRAVKWYNILITRVPTDPFILKKMGHLCARDSDQTQAIHLHLESYRYYPIDLDVISYLGVFYVQNGLFERAIQFFERATEIKPGEIKWKLMVASCYRRMKSFREAYDRYKKIHEEDPENVECLRYLVQIGSKLELDDVRKYEQLLKKVKYDSANANPTQGIQHHQQQTQQQHQYQQQQANRRGFEGNATESKNANVPKATMSSPYGQRIGVDKNNDNDIDLDEDDDGWEDDMPDV